jgi:TfoX/Sxy family transcriptional regulator of competence genes
MQRPTRLHTSGRTRNPGTLFDERLAARVRKALSQRDDVSERRMFGGLTFMVTGHMCCGVIGYRLVVRLGTESAGKALGEPHTSTMTFTGRALKGFVYVDADGASSGPALQSWVRRAVAFAATLPGK